jgi:hypothetical protein
MRVLESRADIADTVADENDVDDGIGDPSANRLISSGHHNTPALLFPLPQRRNGNAIEGHLGDVPHPDLNSSIGRYSLRATVSA